MAVTIKDIARELGVSPATVSLALNDSDMISARTAQLVKETAQRMGYVRNVFARGLIKGHSVTLGLIVPDIENPFFASMINQVSRAAHRAGFELGIYIANDSIQHERELINNLQNQNFRAVLVAANVTTPCTDEYVDWLNAEHEAPIIFVGNRYDKVRRPCVCIDVRRAVFGVTQHMIKMGARKLALLTGPVGVDTLDLRRDGFLDAAQQAGVECALWHADGVSYQHAYEYISSCRDDELPDGIVCASDMMALAAYNYLQEKGLRVPEDVMLSGLDDGLIASIAPVPLTTINPDLPGMAEKLMEIVHRVTGGEKLIGNYYIEHRLMTRRSTQR